MGYSPRRVYTEADIDNFIEYAQELGVTRAIKELNYPSWPTAQKWINDRNVTVPTSMVKSLASLNGQMYSMEERLTIVQNLMEQVLESSLNDNDPINIKRLAETYKILTETYNLIQGKATSITQKTDAIDENYIDLLAEMRAENLLIENN